ncbi:RNA-binding domain-containing protein [Heliocybe sulcata]|uniref:RNA-binding domain-containing protein n=1 Tax=Heliocybe sulcata TaxID=5364 RepID=A0A5C3MP17_9AGAM|nr:RNA-binding domain-containing protein [Heliocybe sulcata]
MFKASVQKQLRSLVFSQAACTRLSLAAPRAVATRATWATAAKSFSTSSARLYERDDRRESRGPSQPTTTIYLGNLPFDVAEQDIQSAAEQFGPLKRVAMGRFPDTGRPKGYAHIEFENIEDAQKMVKAHEEDPFYFGERPTKVDYAQPTRPRSDYSQGGGFSRGPRSDRRNDYGDRRNDYGDRSNDYSRDRGE